MMARVKPVIFIVEDNIIYGRMLEGFLIEKFPDIVAVKIFATGESCLLHLYEKPAVVIMDHLLNANDSGAASGLSIMKKIKGACPDIKIILLSAQSEFEVISKTIVKYGCTYVQKDEGALNRVGEIVKGVLES